MENYISHTDKIGKIRAFGVKRFGDIAKGVLPSRVCAKIKNPPHIMQFFIAFLDELGHSEHFIKKKWNLGPDPPP